MLGGLFSAASKSPLFIYLKIGALVFALAGASYTAWSVRGAYAQQETQEAVNSAVEDIQNKLYVESVLRKQYQDLADKKLTDLLKSISNVQAQQASISTSIRAERKRDPDFYNQPLPPGGREEWERAKSLLLSTGSAGSPLSAASSPSSSPR